MTAVEDVQRERDAMLGRSRRGIQRDDEKAPEDWAASLRKVLLEPARGVRHMWVKVGAVALRAVESIDRKAAPWDELAANARAAAESIDRKAARTDGG